MNFNPDLQNRSGWAAPELTTLDLRSGQIPSDDPEALIQAFAEEHRIPKPAPSDDDTPALESVLLSRRAIERNYCTLPDHVTANDPSSGVIRVMLTRGYTYLESAFTALVTGFAPSAEILSRSTLEASLNVRFILHSPRAERPSRIAQYVNSFIAQEKKELSRWEQAVAALGENEQPAHLGAIAKKKEGIAAWTHVSASFYPVEILDPAIIQQPWPKIADRFTALGEDIHYRVLYAAMCSQAHNDAEDLLNEIFVRIANDPQIEDRMSKENVYFARNLTYRAAEFMLQAGIDYTSAYGMDQGKEACVAAMDRIRDRQLFFFDRFHIAPAT